MIKENRIQNIREMEDVLNKMLESIQVLNDACEKWEALFPAYNKLSEYYGSEQWHEDREASDSEEFPEDVACGVLSEDAVYNLFIEQRQTALYLAKTAIKALE